jgi:16S rRNA (guanine(966)-N(2))-methyltransferase RsmD
MRIIAGALKGRRLKTPSWEGLRPTSDRLRETLFNIVGARVPGAHVLDAYAGTGAVGIEAISRGAARVVFIERDPRAARLIAENLARCGVENGYAIIRADLARVAAPAGAAAFDVIVLDPPYADLEAGAVVAHAGAWLAPGGLLVLEHARRRPAPPVAGPLALTRTVTSGDSALSFYEPSAAPPPADGETTPRAR